MSKDDPFGARMKLYEQATRYTLPRRTYTILRVDGRAFHTWTKQVRLQTPYDASFAQAMDDAAINMCQEIQGAQFAYVQSDEISVLLTDFATIQSQPWFDGQVQKMCSVGACIAAVMLSAIFDEPCQFDARVLTIGDPVEVANYFVWRQRDAERNAVSMAAQTMFSHRQLHGKTNSERREMMEREHGVRWDDYAPEFRHGRTVTRHTYATPNPHPNAPPGAPGQVTRERWESQAAPHFSATSGWLPAAIPSLPRLVSPESAGMLTIPAALQHIEEGQS